MDAAHEPTAKRLKRTLCPVAKSSARGAVGDLSFFKTNGKGLPDELASQLGLASCTVMAFTAR